MFPSRPLFDLLSITTTVSSVWRLDFVVAETGCDTMGLEKDVFIKPVKIIVQFIVQGMFYFKMQSLILMYRDKWSPLTNSKGWMCNKQWVS